MKIKFLITSWFLLLVCLVHAQNTALSDTQNNSDRSIRTETKLEELSKRMDTRFQSIDTRFQSIKDKINFSNTSSLSSSPVYLG